MEEERDEKKSRGDLLASDMFLCSAYSAGSRLMLTRGRPPERERERKRERESEGERGSEREREEGEREAEKERGGTERARERASGGNTLLHNQHQQPQKLTSGAQPHGKNL